jgi:hypothetical protein
MRLHETEDHAVTSGKTSRASETKLLIIIDNLLDLLIITFWEVPLIIYRHLFQLLPNISIFLLGYANIVLILSRHYVIYQEINTGQLSPNTSIFLLGYANIVLVLSRHYVIYEQINTSRTRKK